MEEKYKIYCIHTTQLNSPAASYLLRTQTDTRTAEMAFASFKNNPAFTYTQTHTAEMPLVSLKNNPAFTYTLSIIIHNSYYDILALLSRKLKLESHICYKKCVKLVLLQIKRIIKVIQSETVG